jgi:hypothetical protein
MLIVSYQIDAILSLPWPRVPTEIRAFKNDPKDLETPSLELGSLFGTIEIIRSCGHWSIR